MLMSGLRLSDLNKETTYLLTYPLLYTHV